MSFKVFVFLIFFSQFIFAATGKISGIVKNSETRQPLVGANLEIKGIQKGGTTNEAGEFLLKDIPEGNYQIRVSYLGYRQSELSVTVEENTNKNIEILLAPTSLLGKEVVVVANRAEEGETPVAFETLSREDIETRYFAQDVPVILSEMPSTTFYSESGNGVGYNYLSIRGFGQRRISVLINGVPQNDPEDHNVYWVDFPDFLGNVEDIQVQRGAGSSFYGPPAIGGSVNIITSHFSQDRGISAYAGRGSFGTRKLSLALNSGLIKDHYVLFGRISQIKSDGYRDRSWVNFKSYFIGAARFGKNSSTRLHFYGGPIKDGLVYEGIPRFFNSSKELRKKNYSYWETENNKLTYASERRPDEVENFNQPHLELIHEVELSDKMKLTNTLFGIRGYGFFDYDGSWAPLSYYRLTPEYGFEVKDDPESIYADQILIRAYVDNRQAGWMPQWHYNFNRGKIVAGSEIRLHRSLHWGRIQKGSNDLPAAASNEYEGLNYIGSRKYYEYRGAKNIFAPYLHTLYKISPELAAMFDLQIAFKKYRLYDEKFLNNEFDINYQFLNPRFGLNYKVAENLNVFSSISRTNREPRLKNYYDAAEASTPDSWGPIEPQFETNPDGTLDFDSPKVQPESLNDFELGLGYLESDLKINLNYFYMDFQNEIIKKGQVDRFGQPITGNAESTLHQGVEFSLRKSLTSTLHFSGNFTYSKNKLKKYSEYDWGGTEIKLNGNPIAGFPDVLGNLRLTYFDGQFRGSLAMQHVGRQYTDNYKNPENVVDAYTVFHGMLGLSLKNISGLSNIQIQMHIQNIFDKLYLTYGEGNSFFPAAERQLFLGVNFDI